MFEFEMRRRAPRAWVVWVALGLMLVATGASADARGGDPRVDLNRATAEELAELPGIGAAKAAAIVAHRSASGAFASLDDLQAVRGIGPAMVTKLRSLVTLDGKRDATSRAKSGGTEGPQKPGGLASKPPGAK